MSFCCNRCNGQRCRRLTILEDQCCGVCVTSTPSTCCSKVCCRVTYTVVVKNNCTSTMRNAFLHVPLDGVFCLDTSSVTVNGEAVSVDCLDAVPLCDIASEQEVTVVYTVTIMEYKRYIKSRVLVSFYTCCCCERRDLGVYSNVNCLQVCPCCCCCNGENN